MMFGGDQKGPLIRIHNHQLQINNPNCLTRYMIIFLVLCRGKAPLNTRSKSFGKQCFGGPILALELQVHTSLNPHCHFRDETQFLPILFASFNISSTTFQSNAFEFFYFFWAGGISFSIKKMFSAEIIITFFFFLVKKVDIFFSYLFATLKIV